jgi:hypothetical protein
MAHSKSLISWIVPANAERISRGLSITPGTSGKKEQIVLSVKVGADLRCYFCGYSSTRIEGEQGRPLAEARLVQTATGVEGPVPSRASLRCSRCNGPLFMDPLEVVHSYKKSFALEPPTRRGRPPHVFVDSLPAVSP